MQHIFTTFVGGKLLGPTILGSPSVRTVGVGVTSSLLLWKFCWTYRFWLPNDKNCWPVRTVVETFDSFVRATFLSFVGPTVSGPQECWGDFSPCVGPTISGSQDFPVFCLSYSFRPSWQLGRLFPFRWTYNFRLSRLLGPLSRSGTKIVDPIKGKKYLQHFSEPKSVEMTKELQQMRYNYLQHQKISSTERQNL